MKSQIKKIGLNYNDKMVFGRKLTVSSKIPISIKTAWNEVQKSSLLEFVAKGKVKFKPIDGAFPEIWKEKMTVRTVMLIYGFIPFGGIHTLFFKNIDSENYSIETKEKDDSAKVWNHKISLQKIDANHIQYTDEVTIYGGILTTIITYWARLFYKHRQKRWLIVAKNSTAAITKKVIQ